MRWGSDALAGDVCEVTPELGDLDIDGAQLVAPGDIERSVIYQRTARRDASGMPPLGSNALDHEGLAVLERWINSDFCE